MPKTSVMQQTSGKWDSVEFTPGNGSLMGFDPATGAAQQAVGVSYDVSGNLTLTGNVVMGSKYMELVNMTAPSAPAATKVRLYAADNGGKVTLYALFPTGAARSIIAEL